MHFSMLKFLGVLAVALFLIGGVLRGIADLIGSSFSEESTIGGATLFFAGIVAVATIGISVWAWSMNRTRVLLRTLHKRCIEALRESGTVGVFLKTRHGQAVRVRRDEDGIYLDVVNKFGEGVKLLVTPTSLTDARRYVLDLKIERELVSDVIQMLEADGVRFHLQPMLNAVRAGREALARAQAKEPQPTQAEVDEAIDGLPKIEGVSPSI